MLGITSITVQHIAFSIYHFQDSIPKLTITATNVKNRRSYQSLREQMQWAAWFMRRVPGLETPFTAAPVRSLSYKNKSVTSKHSLPRHKRRWWTCNASKPIWLLCFAWRWNNLSKNPSCSNISTSTRAAFLTRTIWARHGNLSGHDYANLMPSRWGRHRTLKNILIKKNFNKVTILALVDMCHDGFLVVILTRETFENGLTLMGLSYTCNARK